MSNGYGAAIKRRNEQREWQRRIDEMRLRAERAEAELAALKAEVQRRR